MNSKRDLIMAVDELTGVLREIKDWLLTRKVDSPKKDSPPWDTTSPIPPTKPIPENVGKPHPTYKCPVCQGVMIIRMARATGDLFCGCKRYPDCTGARSIEGKNTTRSGAKSATGALNLPPGKYKSDLTPEDPMAQVPDEENDVPF